MSYRDAMGFRQAGWGGFPAPWDESAQIVTALRTLGLGIFPFDSFDLQGRLVSEPNVDPDLKRELDEALTHPDWKRLFSTLSLFDNPGHNASYLGFTLENTANLVVVRSVDTLSSPAGAGKWYAALVDERNLLAGIQDSAGKAYFVKPSWIDAIRKILGLLHAQATGDEAVASEQLAGLATIKTAIEFVLGVLEIANRFGRRHSVSCAVVWEYPSWRPALSKEAARAWASVGTVLRNGGRNVSGVLWDPRNRTIWNWANTYPWTGLAIQPGSLFHAWYPSGLLVDAAAPDERREREDER
jgi:hypothetical protein